MTRMNPSTVELKKPWNSRVRMDKNVTGAIEVAFLRGYQAGYEDRAKGKRPKHYVNVE